MVRCTVAWLAAFAAYALAHAWTLANPGWFSHDELQWGYFATAEPQVGAGWFDNTVFQYRPLTFQLWLWIARGLFAMPAAYHALWVILGFGICGLLFGAMRRAGAAPRGAFAAAAAFALNPYAAYVHGWVATLSELLWTGCALGIAWVGFDARRPDRHVALATLVLTTVALLAKEAALAIVPLLALAGVLTRERRWLVAMAASAVPAAAYLALRLPTLLFAPRPGGAYAWSVGNAPWRYAELHGWPWLPTVLETASLTAASPMRLLAVAAVALMVWAVVLHARPRLGAALIAGSALALGPALVLATGFPQYGYAASALACACIAGAWPAMGLPGRTVIVFALALSTWHGVNVQREMLRVGTLEAAFTPSLRPLLARPGDMLVLVPETPADAWIYQRLSESLPLARRGVRVEADGNGTRIAPDGVVKP